MSNTELTTIDDKPLTANEIVFVKHVAQGYSYTQAYRKAFPAKASLAYSTIRKNAFKLATKSNIATEVSTTKERTAHMARLAEDRIEEILTEDDSQRKGNKVADVAMFMYDHANGKAMQRTQVEGKYVTVTYDLSGGKGGEVPQEIIDQLNSQE